MAAQLLDTMVFREEPDVSVVGGALGATAWLDDPSRWAADGVPRLLAAFLDEVPAGAPLWFRTSLLEEWRQADTAHRREEVIAALPPHWLQGRPRHFFSFELADDPQVPTFGLAYTEVDEHRAARPSSLELTLPQDGDPRRLEALVRRLVDLGPVLAAVGGYAARWNPLHERLAFAQIRLWCKRYLGLDVQDREDMAWRLAEGLPGTNWLTLVGPAPADRLRLDLRALVTGPWKEAEAEALPGGAVLLRAGRAPVLADVNRGEFPFAYAEVAQRLAPAFVKEPPRFPGGFDEHEGTVAWLRRLVEPEGWQ